MRETREQIRELLDIIENGDENKNNNGLSMDQIRQILLGRSHEKRIEETRNASISRALLLKQNAQLNFYHELPEGTSLRMKVANFFKRIIRKMIRPIMLPIVDAQSRYNLCAQDTIRELYLQQEKLKSEQKALRQLLVTVGRELKESSGENE